MSTHEGSSTLEEVLARPLECVVFDCDSTLSKIEGIDELAGDRRDEIEALTHRAMAGSMPLEEVYAKRLEMLAPRHADLVEVGKRYVTDLTPGALETVRALAFLGKRVCIISGGIREAVMRLANHLGVSGERVFAVDVFFDRDGHYAGYDQHNRLTRDNGKVEVIRELRGEGRRTAMVGDGATDMQCAPYVDRFVAFGGVVSRAAVKEASPLFVDSPNLGAVLPLLLTPYELSKLQRDPAWKEWIEQSI